MTSNDLETRDKAILDAIGKLSNDLNGRMDKLSNDLNGKIDKLEKDVTEIKIGQAELRIEIKNLEKKLTGQSEILDNKIDSIKNTLGIKIDGIDKRVSNLEFFNGLGVYALIMGSIALTIEVVFN